MCNACQKSKGKCDKSSGHGGKQGGGDKKAKAAGMQLLDCDPHTLTSFQRDQLLRSAKRCLPARQSFEVLDNKEAGPSKVHGKCKVSMPIHSVTSGKPVTWSQVAALESTMHNTIRWMWAMEADVHSILGKMRGMELEVAGMLEKLAEMKEGLADT